MTKPAVIVISSHVARGSVGNRSSMFGLETLGFPVWAVSTIQLPWHPGHGLSTRVTPSEDDFRGFLQDLKNSKWITEVGGILTGYMADADQVNVVSDFVTELKDKQPDLLYLCDPVIGDQTGLYVEEATASAIRDKLIPICDVATPNLFEASWLTDVPKPKTLKQCCALSKSISPRKWVITSCPAPNPSDVSNLYLGNSEAICAYHDKFRKAPNGTGDLTAALILGHLLSGRSIHDALKQATATVFEMLKHANTLESDELILAGNSRMILDPEEKINITEFELT